MAAACLWETWLGEHSELEAPTDGDSLVDVLLDFTEEAFVAGFFHHDLAEELAIAVFLKVIDASGR